MKKLNRVQSLTAQCCVCFFIACQLYEPFPEEDVFKGAYQRHFVKTFGPIDPMQDWDFANDKAQGPTTRSGGDLFNSLVPLDADGYYEVESQLISKSQNLGFTERATQSFALEIGANDSLLILPIYQTSVSAGLLEWELQLYLTGDDLEATNTPYTEWEMGSSLQTKATTIAKYQNVGKEGCKSSGVRCRPIAQYINSGHKQLMYFNLCILGFEYPQSIYKKLAPLGSQQSSLNYQMRVVDLPRPEGIDARLHTLFIACDAANFDEKNPYLKNGKALPRYQSLVFMIVAPQLPKLTYVQQDEQGEPYLDNTVVSKRYMIEDLGSSSDFDFNDIVVDVMQQGETPVVVNQSRQSNTALMTTISLGACEPTETSACVRHLCGTKPFQLKVGSHEFQIVTDPTNQEQTLLQLQGVDLETPTYFEGKAEILGWDPDQTVTITDWQPESNNIEVKVWRDANGVSSEGGWSVQFPQQGQVPFIMALPDNMPWNEEGVNFTGWQQFVPAQKKG